MWIYMCLEKSTLIQYRLVLRGRDQVERAFEVSSGGHRGKDILYMHGIYLHIILYVGEHFSLAVLCVSLVHGFCI